MASIVPRVQNSAFIFLCMYLYVKLDTMTTDYLIKDIFSEGVSRILAMHGAERNSFWTI